MAQTGKDTKPEVVRYVVDTSYRAAIRVPDLDAAVALLRIRAERWPELRAVSWLLIGQLQATRAPGQVSAVALEAFKNALAFSTAQERPQVVAKIPDIYRAALN